jgi:Family of unknown function (DUF5372)
MTIHCGSNAAAIGRASSRKSRNLLSTTPDTLSAAATSFRITHPFHPWFDQEFKAIECRRSWREDKVFFRDLNGRSTSLPIAWTSLAVPDPFLVISNRKARFRPRDLLELVDLIDRIRQAEGRGERSDL